jgi:hypothetical protein
MTIYGQQAPVSVEGLTSNTITSTNGATLDLVSIDTNLSGNLTLATASAARSWATGMGNVNGGSNHYSVFNDVVGIDGSVYAMGDDLYDGPIAYVAKFDPQGNLSWQNQVTYDAHEGWSGTVSFGADMGNGNLLIAGSVYNGAYAGFFNIIDTASGQSAGPGAVLYDSEDNNIYISSIAVGANQQIAAVGYIQSYYERYEDTPALAGSGLNLLAVNTAVFGSNVPNTVDVGNGLWSITGGSIGSGSNSVTNLNTWQDLSAEYHVVPTQASGSISFAGASLGYAKCTSA